MELPELGLPLAPPRTEIYVVAIVKPGVRFVTILPPEPAFPLFKPLPPTALIKEVTWKVAEELPVYSM